MKSHLLVPLFLLVIAVTSTVSREISHEDIRDAIMSLVHMFRDTGDKLERHEYRERQLGEQLKKALSGLDKKHRVTDHNMETLSRSVTQLLDRIDRLETTAAEKEERERVQLKKATDAIESIQLEMSRWTDKLNQLTSQHSELNQVDKVDPEATLGSRLDHVTAAVERLENQIANIADTKASLALSENLKIASVNLDSADSKWRSSLEDTERLLKLYEARLDSDGSVAVAGGGSGGLKVPSDGGLPDWHAAFLAALESQERVMDELKQIAERSERDIAEVPKRHELTHLHNLTQESLQDVRYELSAGTDMAAAKLDGRITESMLSLGQGHEEILKRVTETGVMSENLYGDVSNSYEQLLKEVQGLAKVEQVMIQTADNVLDTKRRIEYGVHQILLEVGDLVKIHSKQLNNTVNTRFDDISSTILDNQNGAITNLTSKIETEMGQVWRQIGIMYQQLTASAGALDRLQMQTETYVNGSLQTMDSMEGKVGQITGRMSEVDDNLNYLLGRLSLVTQEFNLIKSGLATALDNIRSSFISVQNKIQEVGPGPNPITNETVDQAHSNNDQDNQVPVSPNEVEAQ